MNKASKTYCLIVAGALIVHLSEAYASERLLDASVSARIEHNDNIFLVQDPEGSVTGITITPEISGIIREQNWETRVTARLGINKYSEHDLDSNDQYFNLFGSYREQRNIFSLGINHDLVSSLTFSSVDIGLGRVRIKRKTQSLSPVYTRIITERLRSSFTYIYSDIDFLDAEDTNFTPYIVQTGVVSLQYDLTQRDNVSLVLRGVDYVSKDESVSYQLFVTNLGIVHQFSETLTSNFQIGVSRQNTTNLRTQTEDFFGGIIILTREIDSQNRGLVYNAGLTQILETGSINANISRSDSTNSFGGLDVINKLTLGYDQRITELWRYDIDGSYSDVTQVTTGVGTNDRDIFSFNALARYSINPNWGFTASYRYLLRKFKSNTSDDRAPHSNTIFLGLTYNFPSYSTF